ncbi:glycosyltransferase family 2 protein [Sphingomonas abietis]|uniref:Glycosyltransferase n=1 Tax=Sphingomonas abietis TaxID=3012344 RepID=A0ABY7NHU2_9SPHN|nr:hypothetical protein [Sphingomonas abietis]WBO20837.1 hypothetical protein PBT88_11500 [Sphingomonas abietis]
MRSISFVVCTFEKEKPDERLAEVLANLRRQIGIEFEVILVWEGCDLGNVPAYDGVIVIPVGLISISEKRNIGGLAACSDMICFLDDDTFPLDHDFGIKVLELMDAENLDFVTCNIHSTGAVMSGEGLSADTPLDERNIIAHMWEPGLTVRRQAFVQTQFDPTLGIACIHGSSEGFDFGYRLLKNGFKGRRMASFFIDHPPLDTAGDYRAERAFFYSLGNGAVLIQHGYYFTYVWQMLKTVARLLVSLLKGDVVRARASFIRALCMMIGPFLPRRRGRIMPTSFLALRDRNSDPAMISVNREGASAG